MEYNEENFKKLLELNEKQANSIVDLNSKILAVPSSVEKQELADFIEGTLEISATGESIAKAVLAYYRVLQK